MNPNNYFALQWYQKEEEKRKNNQRNNQIFLINQNVQRVIEVLNHKLKDNEQYNENIDSIMRKSRGIRINHLRGRQYYENIDIAVWSFEFLYQSLLLLEDKGTISRLCYDTHNSFVSLQNLAYNHRDMPKVMKLRKDVTEHINNL